MENRGKTRYRKWYCPNCSKLVSGAVEYSGDVNVKCRSCGTIMSMKKAGRRKYIITVFLAEEEPDYY